MYNVKLKRDFIKLSDAGLAARSAQIVNSLTANFSTAPFLPGLTPATNITVSNGLNPGELALRFDTVPGAYGYSYQYTLDPITESSIWSSTIGKRIKYTFTGLQTGQRYWVRVVAVGRNEQAAESEPVLTRIVQ